MHFVLILGLLITVSCIPKTYANEIPAKLVAQAKKLHNLCQKEQEITDAQIKRIIAEDFPNDRNIQCYIHCLFDKVGLIDNANQMHLEYLVEMMPEQFHELILSLAEACGTKPGADGCETAFLTAKCYYDKKPSLKEQFSFIFS